MLLICSAAFAEGGSVEGTLTVTRDGKPGFVKNALIYIAGYEDKPAPSKQVKMAQTGRAFDKVVLPVVKKDRVAFANEEPLDSIYHHVFSPDKKLEVNSPKFRPGDPAYLTQPLTYLGPMTVFCDIHKEMISTVYVLENDRFTLLATAEGDSAPFKIDGIRPGKWTIVAWHRSAQKTVQLPVEIKEGQTTKINLTLNGDNACEKGLLDHSRRYGKYGVKPDGGAAGEKIHAAEDEKWQ